MKLEHYLKALRYRNNTGELTCLEPEERTLVKDWIQKLNSGEIMISSLSRYPWHRYTSDYIREVRDSWEMFGDSEQEQIEKERFFANGRSRWAEMSYSSPFLITPKIQEAIDTLPGEFIYLDTELNEEEEWEGIHGLMKINVQCEPSLDLGVREFSSSKEVVDYLESNFPALKTYYFIPPKDYSFGILTIDYLRSQMLEENAATLVIHIDELGINTELPASIQENENGTFCYRIDLAGTPFEEWFRMLSERSVPILCEVTSPKDVLIKMDLEVPVERCRVLS